MARMAKKIRRMKIKAHIRKVGRQRIRVKAHMRMRRMM